ncbi:conserved hypothetical protein [Talaromyces stipitatus ATCC 10500]|uniref:Mediator complex subunit 27 n=1 Tax=Talaromyces stipitatus (strain ATCC 10500 / CBS 375.48 / QM 6759 / NRRL 1006) TaxID=441959 RepID=B8MAY7_TALSN|nr:uncharacterized protein TSTA_124160 [Talaromyces stipitatus ATCC 10500]EED18688.1 conserved hypothetical protein [Talaromyces stipitatus ATCC 10500]
MSTDNPTMQTGTADGNTAVKLEESSLNQHFQSIDWDSERQLVTSLAKLQELESKIHELRSLLPDRLLAPITPIINPRHTKDGSTITTSIPRNPQQLNALLRKSATEGVEELNRFRQLWLSSDMQAIWKRVDEKLAETKGAFPQVEAGMWQVDYEGLLREMDEEGEQKKDAEKEGQGGGDVMEVDAQGEKQLPAGIISSVYGTPETDLKTVMESFQNRSIPGFRLGRTKNESMILVSLGLAGLTFEVHEVLTTGSETTTTTTTSSETTGPESSTSNKQSPPEWRVSSRNSFGRPSRLENAILHQLNSRPRKWDLCYLLEYVLSYSNIRSQPCKKCNHVTGSLAQLPIVRKPVALTSAGDGSAPAEGSGNGASNELGVVWEAYHQACI